MAKESRLNKVKLSTKEQRIAAAHLKGARHQEIGDIEYPQATDGSKAVLVSRTLKKDRVAQYVEQGKLQTLKKYNVTWDTITAPRIDALQAVKVVSSHTEPDYELPDHSIRLKAASDLERMMDSKQLSNEESAPLNLPSDLDAIQIVQAWKSPPHHD